MISASYVLCNFLLPTQNFTRLLVQPRLPFTLEEAIASYSQAAVWYNVLIKRKAWNVKLAIFLSKRIAERAMQVLQTGDVHPATFNVMAILLAKHPKSPFDLHETHSVSFDLFCQKRADFYPCWGATWYTKVFMGFGRGSHRMLSCTHFFQTMPYPISWDHRISIFRVFT